MSPALYRDEDVLPGTGLEVDEALDFLQSPVAVPVEIQELEGIADAARGDLLLADHPVPVLVEIRDELRRVGHDLGRHRVRIIEPRGQPVLGRRVPRRPGSVVENVVVRGR